MRHTLKKSEILRGRNSFREVFENGRKCECKFLRCFYLLDEQTNRSNSAVSAGFAVSRQFTRAVDRNRVKRLMRESYRIHKQILIAKCQVQLLRVRAVFLYAPPSNVVMPLPSFGEIDEMMQSLLSAINIPVRV
ncbi:MAG: ribonuclease P protein component [Bacteroidota bacterium]